MRWSELLAVVEGEVLVPGDDFEFANVAAADMMSDILATEKEQFVIFTGQTSPSMVRMAIAVGALGVIIVRGKTPLHDTIKLAAGYGLPMAKTEQMMFEACYVVGRQLWSSPLSTSSSTG